MVKKEMYRQGDILFVRIERIPKQHANKKMDGVVAEGEATGHAHRVVDGDLWERGHSGIDLFVEAGVATKIVHEEHGTIELPKGVYKVVRQREFADTDGRTMFVND